MSQTSAPTRAINFPVILLWVASVAVAAIGYLIVTTGINAQVDFYGPTSSQEPRDLLTGQSYAAIGATLIGVGVLGLLLAIAVHANSFAIARAQAALTFDDFSDLEDDAEIVHSTSTPAAVVVEEEVIVVADAAPEAAAAQADEAAPAEAPATETPDEAPKTK